MRAASSEAATPASFVTLARPASDAASRPKKMSKSFAIGRQASSRSAWRVTRSVRVCTRSQRLRTPRFRKSLRELAAALRVVPEEVVRDEDASPTDGEVVDDGADRALAERAAVELPDGTEVAAERAAARGLDEPDGLEEKAVVAVAVALHQVARRNRHGVERRAIFQGRAWRSSRRARGRAGRGPRSAAARQRGRRPSPARPLRRRRCRSRRSPEPGGARETRTPRGRRPGRRSRARRGAPRARSR